MQPQGWPLTESERSLIESGTVTYAEVMEGRRMSIEAKEEERREQAEVREWDRWHCPVCGADIREEPEHCR